MLSGDNYLTSGGMVDVNWQYNTNASLVPLCKIYDRSDGNWYNAPPLNTPRAFHAMVHLHKKNGGVSSAGSMPERVGRMDLR